LSGRVALRIPSRMSAKGRLTDAVWMDFAEGKYFRAIGRGPDYFENLVFCCGFVVILRGGYRIHSPAEKQIQSIAFGPEKAIVPGAEQFLVLRTTETLFGGHV